MVDIQRLITLGQSGLSKAQSDLTTAQSEYQAKTAEYETLVGRQDKATAGMSAQSMAHLIIVAFIIFGNVAFSAILGCVLSLAVQ